MTEPLPHSLHLQAEITQAKTIVLYSGCAYICLGVVTSGVCGIEGKKVFGVSRRLSEAWLFVFAMCSQTSHCWAKRVASNSLLLLWPEADTLLFTVPSVTHFQLAAVCTFL